MRLHLVPILPFSRIFVASVEITALAFHTLSSSSFPYYFPLGFFFRPLFAPTLYLTLCLFAPYLTIARQISFRLQGSTGTATAAISS